MTRHDKAHQRVIRRRMDATGERYTVARRNLAAERQPTTVVLAKTLHHDLVAEFAKAGWPVEWENFAEFGGYRSYPGPAAIRVGRECPESSTAGDEDPDSEALDLTMAPYVEVSAPLLAQGRAGVDVSLDGSLGVGELVSTIDGQVGQARAAAVAVAVVGVQECVICGDRLSAGHLLQPTVAEQLLVCPACVFDGDLFAEPVTEYLAYQFDELTHTDLAVPASWAAVAALLACAAGPGLEQRLEQAWKEAGSLSVPCEHWADPGQLWIWLPPGRHRSPALAGLGAGARLGAVVAAVEAARPGLREEVRDHQRRCWLDGADDDEAPVSDRFVEQIWPAVVAYAVTLATDAAERPQRGPAWDVLESFDALRWHLSDIGSDLEAGDIEDTIASGLHILAEVLDLPDRGEPLPR